MNIRKDAFIRSAQATANARARFNDMGLPFSPSTVLPMELAHYVAQDAAENAELEAWRELVPVAENKRTPGLLGCWVNGKLRFQSRDHDNVHAYAADKMNDKGSRDVWVAPVGSFPDDNMVRKTDARKTRKIKAAA